MLDNRPTRLRAVSTPLRPPKQLQDLNTPTSPSPSVFRHLLRAKSIVARDAPSAPSPPSSFLVLRPKKTPPTPSPNKADGTSVNPSQSHPARPPRNPARTSSIHSPRPSSSGSPSASTPRPRLQRPSSSGGAGQVKSVWDASAASIKTATKPISDFMRRRSSISSKVPNNLSSPLQRSASTSKQLPLDRPSALASALSFAPADTPTVKAKGGTVYPASAPQSPRLTARALGQHASPPQSPRIHAKDLHTPRSPVQRSKTLDPAPPKSPLFRSKLLPFAPKSPLSKSKTLDPRPSPSKFRPPKSPPLAPLEPRDMLEIPMQPRASNLARSGSRKGKEKEKPAPDELLRFPTADRMILAELKAEIQARDAQFQMRNGRRYHGFPLKEVPYPRAYGRIDLDHDVWETGFCQQACGSVTWHVFETPPTKVLDLGCGTGAWIIDCAKVWRECQFVGMDVVPLQPDLQKVGLGKIASRITWVQGNFLEQLPFPDDEFDFIHVKRIARGVPEDKWNALFEEILRVMKPGAAFEMLEEDLHFPGAQRQTPTSSPIASPVSSRPASPSPIRPLVAEPVEPPDWEESGAWSTAPTPAETVPSSRYETPRESLLPTPDPSVVALSMKKTPESTPGATPSPSASVDFAAWGPPDNAPSSPRIEPTAALPRISTGAPPLFLRRTPAKPPDNPRDHSLLAIIYSEMHSERWINLQPLPLLANYISDYFKDVRTHPPIMMYFPPRLPQPFDNNQYDDATDDDLDTEDSPVLSRSSASMVPSTSRSSSSRRSWGGHPSAWVGTQELIHRSVETLMSLDEARASAFSPSTHASFPAQSQQKPTPGSPQLSGEHDGTPRSMVELSLDQIRPSRMPNKQLDLDLRSLNLHLSLRATEVLSCAEGMWDWIVGYQQRIEGKISAGNPVNLDADHKRLVKMTRDEFDLLLSWFEFDMQDEADLRCAVAQRFGWRTWQSPRTQERRAFDLACERWAAYERLGDRARRGRSLVARGRGEGLDGLRGFDNIGGPSEPQKAPYPPLNLLRGIPEASLLDPSLLAQLMDAPRRLSRTVRVFVAWKAGG